MKVAGLLFTKTCVIGVTVVHLDTHRDASADRRLRASRKRAKGKEHANDRSYGKHQLFN